MIDAFLAPFRTEVYELIDSLTRDLLALEKRPNDAEALASCLRSAHTLKGTARFMQQVAIGNMAHTLEDALSPLRESEEVPESEYFSDLLRIVAHIREAIDALGAPDATKAATETESQPHPTTADSDTLKTLRVNITEMDQLLDGLSEAAIQLDPLHGVHDTIQQSVQLVASLQESVRDGKITDYALLWGSFRATLDDLRSRLVNAEQAMTPSLSKLERELGGLRKQASTLRLLPVSSIFGALELAVRDAALLLGKSVHFEVTKSEAKLEGHILLSVREALLHIVRNAVDHGIEPMEDRFGAGKPLAGTIRIDVAPQGRRVEFRCSDDGRGIDPEKTRNALVKSGRLTEAQAASLDPALLFEILFETGVSTASAVTEISGRGVGLDVVRNVARRLRGQATLRSELGRGTVITIDVPMSLSAMTVLSVAVGPMTLLLPLHAVRGTLRVNVGDVIRNSDRDCILYEDRPIPFVPLGPLLGASSRVAESRKTWAVIVVQSGTKWLALGADRLFETMDIVVKPLPPGVDAPRSIAGAALDSQGDPLLVLDPSALEANPTTFLRAAPGPGAPLAHENPRLPILVIDDSLTTRMLEQSILEAAGYTVDLCASAEDALLRAQKRQYGLFIVDVEMPGMNGFEFTRATRANPALCSVPVIMVTSLATSADRKRGKDAGASDYIVKGDFDQNHFIRKVAELLRTK